MEGAMTQLEQAVIDAIEDRVAQHGVETDVIVAALQSAIDDLMVHQAALEQENRRRGQWLEAIAELTPEKDLESSQALARVALRTGHWPPGNRR